MPGSYSRGPTTPAPHDTEHYREGLKKQKRARLGNEWWRTFTSVESYPKVRERSEPALVLPDAHIRFGKEADFDAMIFEELTSGFGQGDDDDDDEERERISVSQEAVLWTDFRVESSIDPDAYHITRIARVCAMAGPGLTCWRSEDGKRVSITTEGAQLVLQIGVPPHDQDGVWLKSRDEGQEPLSPPPLHEIGEDDD